MKMLYTVYLTFLLVIFSACSGKVSDTNHSVQSNSKRKKKDVPVIEQKSFSDGLRIEWYKKTSEPLLKDGDLVEIRYEVRLKDGKIIDGNKLANKASLPFLIGFNMQTPGWDIALRQLHSGDSARILIPSKLARGDKGIKGIFPPNSDNILYIKVLNIEPPTKIIDGTRVWLLEENKSNKLKFNDKQRVFLHAIGSTPSIIEFVNTFRLGKPFSFSLSDYGLVPGLKKALVNCKKFDRFFIVVPPDQAYGTKGYLDLVKPNEPVFYNVVVMDVVNEPRKP
jgi:FKBP-type peptidyl-prolyl cis-trans isomerase